MVVSEAMSCGRGCLVSDGVGCGPDLIENGESGWVFPRRDWVTLSSRMIEIAGDRGRIQAMGHAARQKMAQNSIDVIVQRTVETFSKVLSS
jgi:glycosyltransferase involved in cell wall biosynthesis